ncbi:MAG TPA: hypothetical protein VFG21_10745, partial [Xanthomonadaceae bacterium]|nr:hypothetical protein [Xanthomonadaceae bacterium]
MIEPDGGQGQAGADRQTGRADAHRSRGADPVPEPDRATQALVREVMDGLIRSILDLIRLAESGTCP